MALEVRPYDHQRDFDRVGQFLINSYQPGPKPPLWVQPRWEYMHFHPLIKKTDITKIGVAEVDGALRGLVHHEHDHGIIYMQVMPDDKAIKAALLDHAEAVYGGAEAETGRERLAIFIHETDQTLQRLAAARGYVENVEIREVTACYDLTKGVPETLLPEGFRLRSLAEDNDLRKVNQVLWRGFNHPGPAPEAEIAGRKFMQQAPNFRHDLTIVAVAPNGDYVSFCGIWVVPANRIAYVEPVATDPDYRRQGLGAAVVLESMRRTIPLGGEVAWVGSEQPFYRALGFEPAHRATAWVKYR